MHFTSENIVTLNPQQKTVDKLTLRTLFVTNNNLVVEHST